ncbi:MAG: DUF484 family protein, partial [Desulfobacterales bacterium]
MHRQLEIDRHLPPADLEPQTVLTGEGRPRNCRDANINWPARLKSMISYEELIERLQRNEAIAKKFHAIELRILSILNFKDFFEVLLTEIEKQFGVPYAWITLIDASETAPIRKGKASAVLKERLCVIDSTKFAELFGNRHQPVLVNENLGPYFQLLPPVRKYLIRSLALAPIFLDGKILGSLNQADFTKERFEPGLDTSLLEQLAVKVSLCLSNVTAHEKLQLMAFRDPLTGLLNRRVMNFALRREFNRARRYQAPLAVVFID